MRIVFTFAYSASMDISIKSCFQLSPCFQLFIGYPEVEIIGSYNNSGIWLLINCSSVFSQWLYHFTFPAAMHKSSNFSHFCQHLLFSVLCLFLIAILMGVKWCITVVLICIPIMTSDEHIFMCFNNYIWHKSEYDDGER